MNWKKLSELYAVIALNIVNLFVIFVVINIAASIFLSMHKLVVENDPVSVKYGKANLKTVYPELNELEIQNLLRETWSRPYIYEPFTQFSEREYHGKYVNVNAGGFRHVKDQAPWPVNNKQVNVFLFGGSTTFGYGVEDSQTIASHLQQQLRLSMGNKANIYNFGRGFYYSTQERVLFEKLLSEGHIPTMAIFLDGLNDFYHYSGEPLYTERFRDYMNGGAQKLSVYSKLPVIRFLKLLWGGGGKENREQDGVGEAVRYDDHDVLHEVITRYFENKKLIEAVAAGYGVKTVFVWQPVPTFGYDTKYHLFAGKDFAGHTYSKYGYALMQAYTAEHPASDNFIWAADIQNNAKLPLYVDQVHYSGEFSRRLAGIIAEFVGKRF